MPNIRYYHTPNYVMCKSKVFKYDIDTLLLLRKLLLHLALPCTCTFILFCIIYLCIVNNHFHFNRILDPSYTSTQEQIINLVQNHQLVGQQTYCEDANTFNVPTCNATIENSNATFNQDVVCDGGYNCLQYIDVNCITTTVKRINNRCLHGGCDSSNVNDNCYCYNLYQQFPFQNCIHVPPGSDFSVDNELDCNTINNTYLENLPRCQWSPMVQFSGNKWILRVTDCKMYDRSYTTCAHTCNPTREFTNRKCHVQYGYKYEYFLTRGIIINATVTIATTGYNFSCGYNDLSCIDLHLHVFNTSMRMVYYVQPYDWSYQQHFIDVTDTIGLVICFYLSIVIVIPIIIYAESSITARILTMDRSKATEFQVQNVLKKGDTLPMSTIVLSYINGA